MLVPPIHSAAESSAGTPPAIGRTISPCPQSPPEVPLNPSTECTIERATAETLPDAYGLHPDRAEAQTRLEQFRQRVAQGQARPEQFVLLRSRRGVEGVALLPKHPHVPLVVHTREGASAGGLTPFYAELRAAAPERTLLLDSTLAALDPGPALEAGWKPSAPEQVLYETDLAARTWALTPGTLEGGAELLERPDLAALLAELGQGGWTGGPDWRVVALLGEAGLPVALGALGPSNRPGWASINLIGVQEGERGRGLGGHLHAHLLARAAERFAWHAGGTEADNQAMRRIFERNGSQLRARQLYFRSGFKGG